MYYNLLYINPIPSALRKKKKEKEVRFSPECTDDKGEEPDQSCTTSTGGSERYTPFQLQHLHCGSDWSKSRSEITFLPNSCQRLPLQGEGQKS